MQPRDTRRAMRHLNRAQDLLQMPRMPMEFGAADPTSCKHRDALEFGGFDDLPDDLKQNILSKLHPIHMFKARKTSKKMKDICDKVLEDKLQLSLDGQTATSIHCTIDQIAVVKDTKEVYVVKLIVEEVENEDLAKRWNETHFTPLVPGRVMILNAIAKHKEHVRLFVGNSPGMGPEHGIWTFFAFDQKNKFISWLDTHVPFVYQYARHEYEPFDQFDESRYRDTALGAEPAPESS